MALLAQITVPLAARAQTQIRIDQITWNVTGNSFTVVVRNTGSVAATIESIALRLSSSGSTYYTKAFTSSNSINTGTTVSFLWTESGALARAKKDDS